MAVRKFKPVTPGQRNKVISAFDEITCSVPEKSLLAPLKRTGGRNNSGKMTMRYIGGGHKKMYRIIDFLRNKDNYTATVKTIEYDPNRSARIALVVYADGEKRYILAPNGLQVGQVVVSGPDVAPEIGNALPMANIPLGTLIHNIELRPGQGACMVRSAGVFAQLSSREDKYAIIKLPSGELRKVLSACKATVGVVGNFAAEGVGFWDIVSGVKAMTLAADGTYTLETEVPAAFEFKILLSEDGATWSWDLGQASESNFPMGLDLKANVTVEAWKGL